MTRWDWDYGIIYTLAFKFFFLLRTLISRRTSLTPPFISIRSNKRAPTRYWKVSFLMPHQNPASAATFASPSSIRDQPQTNTAREEEPITMELCREVLPLWNFTHPAQPASEVLDQVESLLLHGNSTSRQWRDGHHKRIVLKGRMIQCFMYAFKHYGYEGFGFDARPRVIVYFNPEKYQEPLPDWLQLPYVEVEAADSVFDDSL